MLIGAALIVAAGLFIIWRERRLGIQRAGSRKVMTPQGVKAHADLQGPARRRNGRSSRRPGETPGAPVDRADGFVHFSTAGQLAGTLARHFAGETGLCSSPSTPRRRARRCAGSRRAAARSSRISTGRSTLRRRRSGRGRCDGRALAAADVSLGERLALPLLRRLDPETAHRLALAALRAGLGPRQAADASPRLRTRLAGLELANPLGLAAGFDKNAEAVGPLVAAGFGFVEVGRRDAAAAAGQPAAAALPAGRGPGGDQPLRLQQRRRRRRSRRGWRRGRRAGVVGLNLGANKASPDRAADYAAVLAAAGPLVDFATVNVSSPNTERLRELQGAGGAARRCSPG